MKILKIALLVFSTALLFSCNKKSTEATTAASTASQNTSTTARTGGNRGDRPRGNRGGGDQAARAEAMYAALNLSEPQLVKVKAIGQKYQDQMQALRQSGSREGMREKMQALRTAQNNELKGVMTTEQFTKYLKMMEEGRGGRGGGQRGGGGK